MKSRLEELADKLLDAQSHLSGYVYEAGKNDVPLTLFSEENGYSMLDWALQVVSEVEEELRAAEDCCWGGVIWPIATNGNTDHAWIERCDECAKFETDIDAAEELSRRVCAPFVMSKHPTVRGHRPYLDPVGWQT